jgi:hypothetical protein
MSTNRHEESTLFLMRLWGEDSSDGLAEASHDGSSVGDSAGPDDATGTQWHGKLLRVSTGEARYFSGWSDLQSILYAMLTSAKSEEQSAPTNSTTPGSSANSAVPGHGQGT